MAKRLRLRTKLLLSGMILTVLPLVIVSCILSWQNRNVMQAATSESAALAHADLEHVTDLVYRMVQATHESNQIILKNALNVAKEMVGSGKGVSLSADKVTWDAVNQFSKASTRVELSKMIVGESWLGQVKDLQTAVPVVDQIRKLAGCTSTVFQIMNPAGDMLRVATNVAREDGTRAIGTYIPAVNPDNKPNPVIASVMKGQTYTGRAVVVDAWYLTAYAPLYDANKQILGMLYVGIPEENVISALREAIYGIKVGRTGYVYVLDSKGRYIVSKDGKRNGENIWESKDGNGNLFIQEMVNRALKLNGREIAEQEYPWKNSDDPATRLKIVRVVYFQPWDWVIGVSSYKDELQEGVARLESIGNRSQAILLAVIGASMLLAALIWLFIANGITKPINRMIEVLSDTTLQVSSASGQVSAASETLAEGTSHQAASIEEVSSSLEELASMTRQNADNANQANSLRQEVGQMLLEGDHSMADLAQAMVEISSASTETQKIIKTIDEIAFQTNLLALNAAVEAARAGEAGAGFAVVADEVRNLAMRAAEAAKNTNALIEGTAARVQRGSELATKTSQTFSSAISASLKVGELVAEIASASKEQAQGIELINKAVSEMDKVVQQNAQTAEESASASEEMTAQAQQMKGYVGDLTLLVGGSSDGEGNINNASPVKQPAGRKPAAASLMGSGVRGKRGNDHVQKGNGKSPVHPGQEDLRSEKVIVFDDF